MTAPSPRRADGLRVIVIGAGAVGLFCAFELALRGVNVTLVEADAAPGPDLKPRAASAAAAGMLGPFSETLHEGPHFHRRLGDLCYEGLRRWRDTAAEDPTLARFVRFSGALLIAHDEADEARLHKAFRRAQALGEDADFSSGATDLDPSIFGATVRAHLSLPGEGVVAAAAMMQALAARVVMLGGSFLRAQTVEDIETRGGVVCGIVLEQGARLTADFVIAAPGALGGATLAAHFPALAKLAPVKGILGVARPTALLTLPDVVRSPFGYVVRAGEEVLFGASMQAGRCDLDPDETVLAALQANLVRLLPGADFESPRHAGIGVRPTTPDGAPLVGRSGAPGCLVACGHGRNGWLLAPVTARYIADLLLRETSAAVWSAFPVDRFG